MTDKYLEIKEQLTEEELKEGQPQFFRVRVADKDDAISKISSYEDIFEGVKKFYYHECNHSSDGNSPCVVEDITPE